MTAIAVRNLYKSYGTLEVLHGISFDVADGEVFALLGPNGAGKTTTLEILEGHRRRSGGTVALVGDPELIFLDEPTTGFDPAARRDAWRLVDDLRILGRTIVLTSHYMDEVATWPTGRSSAPTLRPVPC